MLRPISITTVLVGEIAFLLAGGPADRIKDLEVQVANATLSESDRNTALYALQRVDPQRAAVAAEPLLKSEQLPLRLTAGWVRAKAGHADGDASLVELLRDEKAKLSFRGMAAVALGDVKSRGGHAAVVAAAKEERDRHGTPDPAEHREAISRLLLQALGDYRDPADFEVAASLYEINQYRGPAEPLGLFGTSEAQPFLREALRREKNAGSVIEIQLAIARSGGDDGIRFVRELIGNAAKIRELRGQIDLRQEDPLSGRLASDLLRSLGFHSSDQRFLPDLVALLRKSPCAACETAWGAIARIGTAGHEEEIIDLAARMPPGAADIALRVLATNGAAESVRKLGKRIGQLKSAEAYVKRHQEGADQDWFRGRSRLFD